MQESRKAVAKTYGYFCENGNAFEMSRGKREKTGLQWADDKGCRGYKDNKGCKGDSDHKV